MSTETRCPRCGFDVSAATEERILPDGRRQWRLGQWIMHTEYGPLCQTCRMGEP